MTELKPLPRTAQELMCGLAQLGPDKAQQDHFAALVPEQTVAQFNATGPSVRPGCSPGTHRRYAQYPVDVPRLDLPFVHVTWKDATRDSKRRDADVQDFYRWLTQEDGTAQKIFTGDGYRGVRDGRPAVPGPDSLLLADNVADTL